MRIATLIKTSLPLLGLAVLSACEQQSTTTPDSPSPPITRAEVRASDALTDLTAPTTGIAFWIHPNVAFNSLVVVASKDGITSYNVEDGSEVSRIPGVKVDGAAISYQGLGSQARGLLAFFDNDASAFQINAIDNASRSFQPVEGDIPIRGALRGFCFGRARGAVNPILVAIQKGEMTRYAIEVENNTLTASAGIAQSVPEDVQSCAVDNEDGSALITRSNGEIIRITGNEAGELVANTGITEIGDITILVSEDSKTEPQSISGLIVVLNRETGGLHIFNRDDGKAIAIMTVMIRDADSEYGDFIANNASDVMEASSANLGGLYRNGVIALGVSNSDINESPVVRFIPVNALKNALGVAEEEPVNPRGAVIEPEDDALQIDIEFQRAE